MVSIDQAELVSAIPVSGRPDRRDDRVLQFLVAPLRSHCCREAEGALQLLAIFCVRQHGEKKLVGMILHE